MQMFNFCCFQKVLQAWACKQKNLTVILSHYRFQIFCCDHLNPASGWRREDLMFDMFLGKFLDQFFLTIVIEMGS